MLFCHKIRYILMINALLLQNLVVMIYALFPPIFLGCKIVPANFSAFWMYVGHQLSQFSCIHHSPLQSWKLSHTSMQFAQHGASTMLCKLQIFFCGLRLFKKKTWMHFWLLRLYISNLCICYAPIAKVLQSQQMKIRRNVICWRGKGLSWNRTL